MNLELRGIGGDRGKQPPGDLRFCQHSSRHSYLVTRVRLSLRRFRVRSVCGGWEGPGRRGRGGEGGAARDRGQAAGGLGRVRAHEVRYVRALGTAPGGFHL